MEDIVIERTIFRLANALVARLVRPATEFASAVEDLVLLEAASCVGLTNSAQLDSWQAHRFREVPGIPRWYHVIVETVLSGLADPRLSTSRFWGQMNRSTAHRTSELPLTPSEFLAHFRPPGGWAASPFCGPLEAPTLTGVVAQASSNDVVVAAMHAQIPKGGRPWWALDDAKGDDTHSRPQTLMEAAVQRQRGLCVPEADADASGATGHAMSVEGATKGGLATPAALPVFEAAIKHAREAAEARREEARRLAHEREAALAGYAATVMAPSLTGSDVERPVTPPLPLLQSFDSSSARVPGAPPPPLYEPLSSFDPAVAPPPLPPPESAINWVAARLGPAAVRLAGSLDEALAWPARPDKQPPPSASGALDNARRVRDDGAEVQQIIGGSALALQLSRAAAGGAVLGGSWLLASSGTQLGGLRGLNASSSGQAFGLGISQGPSAVSAAATPPDTGLLGLGDSLMSLSGGRGRGSKGRVKGATKGPGAGGAQRSQGAVAAPAEGFYAAPVAAPAAQQRTSMTVKLRGSQLQQPPLRAQFSSGEMPAGAWPGGGLSGAIDTVAAAAAAAPPPPHRGLKLKVNRSQGGGGGGGGGGVAAPGPQGVPLPWGATAAAVLPLIDEQQQQQRTGPADARHGPAAAGPALPAAEPSYPHRSQPPDAQEDDPLDGIDAALLLEGDEFDPLGGLGVDADRLEAANAAAAAAASAAALAPTAALPENGDSQYSAALAEETNWQAMGDEDLDLLHTGMDDGAYMDFEG